MSNLKGIAKIALIFLFTISCSSKHGSVESKQESVNMTVIYQKEIEPDTEYLGKLIMDFHLDTLKLTKKDLRLTALFLNQTKNETSTEYLTKNRDNLPVFGKIEEGNDTLYFSYKFKNEGVFYLEGIIEDAVILNNYYKDGSDRNINNLIKFSRKVTVTKQLNYE